MLFLFSSSFISLETKESLLFFFFSNFVFLSLFILFSTPLTPSTICFTSFNPSISLSILTVSWFFLSLFLLRLLILSLIIWPSSFSSSNLGFLSFNSSNSFITVLNSEFPSLLSAPFLSSIILLIFIFSFVLSLLSLKLLLIEVFILLFIIFISLKIKFEIFFSISFIIGVWEFSSFKLLFLIDLLGLFSPSIFIFFLINFLPSFSSAFKALILFLLSNVLSVLIALRLFLLTNPLSAPLILFLLSDPLSIPFILFFLSNPLSTPLILFFLFFDLEFELVFIVLYLEFSLVLSWSWLSSFGFVITFGGITLSLKPLCIL